MTKITVQIIVNANIEKTWDYFTQPEHIMVWNHASDDWHCPKATNDLKVGGKFSYIMASVDGNHSFDFNGTYLEVILMQKINYHIEGGREVTVLFEENDGKTTVTEIFEAENENSIELQQQGWQSILNYFKKHIES